MRERAADAIRRATDGLGCEPVAEWPDRHGQDGVLFDGFDSGLEIDVELLSDTMFLWLAGEINIAAEPQLSAVLGATIADDPATIILDLNDVRAIHPDGIAVLAGAVLHARRRGIDLRIVLGSAFGGPSDPAAGDADLAADPGAVVGADAGARATAFLSPDDLLRVCVDEPTAGVLVVRPIGEIDLYTVALFRDVVVAALQTAALLVVIDLAGIAFLGAKGVRAVIEAKERASSLGIPLHLAGGNGFIRRLLQICGDDAGLDHCSTVEQALAKHRRSADGPVRRERA
jgi:anti-anti-sigma factor